MAAWLAFVVVAVTLAMAVPTAETTDADYRQGESGRADAMMTDAGLVDVDSENVLITVRRRRRCPTGPRRPRRRRT